MTYRIVITPYAKHQLEMYVAYTATKLKNKQAAKAIMDDAKVTKERLSNVANSLPFCEDETLANYEYRKILFAKHDFFMIYRIDGNKVIVEAMYHELQDYESLFINKTKLK